MYLALKNYEYKQFYYFILYFIFHVIKRQVIKRIIVIIELLECVCFVKNVRIFDDNVTELV